MEPTLPGSVLGAASAMRGSVRNRSMKRRSIRSFHRHTQAPPSRQPRSRRDRPPVARADDAQKPFLRPESPELAALSRPAQIGCQERPGPNGNHPGLGPLLPVEAGRIAADEYPWMGERAQAVVHPREAPGIRSQRAVPNPVRRHHAGNPEQPVEFHGGSHRPGRVRSRSLPRPPPNASRYRPHGVRPPASVAPARPVREGVPA